MGPWEKASWCVHIFFFFLLAGWPIKIFQKYNWNMHFHVMENSANRWVILEFPTLTVCHTHWEGTSMDTMHSKIIYSVPTEMLLDPAKKSATLPPRVIQLARRAEMPFIKDEPECGTFLWEGAGLCWIGDHGSVRRWDWLQLRGAAIRLVGSDKKPATAETS